MTRYRIEKLPTSLLEFNKINTNLSYYQPLREQQEEEERKKFPDDKGKLANNTEKEKESSMSVYVKPEKIEDSDNPELLPKHKEELPELYQTYKETVSKAKQQLDQGDKEEDKMKRLLELNKDIAVKIKAIEELSSEIDENSEDNNRAAKISEIKEHKVDLENLLDQYETEARKLETSEKYIQESFQSIEKENNLIQQINKIFNYFGLDILGEGEEVTTIDSNENVKYVASSFNHFRRNHNSYKVKYLYYPPEQINEGRGAAIKSIFNAVSKTVSKTVSKMSSNQSLKNVSKTSKKAILQAAKQAPKLVASAYKNTSGLRRIFQSSLSKLTTFIGSLKGFKNFIPILEKSLGKTSKILKKLGLGALRNAGVVISVVGGIVGSLFKGISKIAGKAAGILSNTFKSGKSDFEDQNVFGFLPTRWLF